MTKNKTQNTADAPIDSDEEITKMSNVIVRAFRDRPVVLSVAAVDGDYIDVSGETGETLRLPSALVYSYSQQAFRRLSAAWEAGDQRSLADAWSDVSQFQPEIERLNDEVARRNNGVESGESKS